MNLQQGDIIETRIPENNLFSRNGSTRGKVLEVLPPNEVLLRISSFGDQAVVKEGDCALVCHGYTYNKRPA